jgi:hypothetical protein
MINLYSHGEDCLITRARLRLDNLYHSLNSHNRKDQCRIQCHNWAVGLMYRRV